MFTKNQYRGKELPKKGGGLRQFADLMGRGGGGVWQEREADVFEGEG